MCAAGHDAEQVLAPAFDREVVALEVKEDVAGAWRRQAAESFTFGDLAQLVERRRTVARFELKTRLLAHSNESADGSAAGLERNRQRHARKVRQRACAVRVELAALRACDAGDERQMIVGLAFLAALACPRADATVIDRLRVV